MRDYLTEYPLLFRFQELITAEPFVIDLVASGRALVAKEDDGKWWFYGVELGGIEGAGDSPLEAYIRFQQAFREVLADLADEAPDFDTFKARSLDFFNDRNAYQLGRWEKSVTELRSGQVAPEEPFSSMRREPAESLPFLSLARLGGTEQALTNNSQSTVALPDLKKVA